MPRIKAATVADHVAQQRAAVLDAAVTLFTRHGYGEVTLADIAAEVGLARNSLYRYVPDKLHLLVEWYRAVVPRTIADWEAAVEGADPPADRIKRWAACYLDWAASPEHQLVAPLTENLSSLDAATRAEVTDLHRSMMEVVAGVAAEAGVPAEQVPATVDLLAAVTVGAARAESRSAGTAPFVRARLDAALEAIMQQVHTDHDFL